MKIHHNLNALHSHRMMKFHLWELEKSTEKVATGLRINRASDDPTNLAVSEKMRTQIKGIQQAERNTENGMSLLQTTEGYLQQTTEIIHRIRALALKSSNGIYSPEDRQLMQVEVSQLIDEIDRIASQAEFNRVDLLLGRFSRTSRIGSIWFHIGPNAYQRERTFISTMTARSLGFRDETNKTLSISTPITANKMIEVADRALDRVMRQRAELGAFYNRLEYVAKTLMITYENFQASESKIRDADIAEEIINLTTKQILMEASTSMLAQSGIRPEIVLKLLKTSNSASES
ncbi:MAG: flagellin [Leptospiraceae bacterium]|nr:flagellin [Leptospiraceae bacterium]MDW7976906.1 flagellin [Leptospiraceae bacterium]